MLGEINRLNPAAERLPESSDYQTVAETSYELEDMTAYQGMSRQKLLVALRRWIPTLLMELIQYKWKHANEKELRSEHITLDAKK